MASVELDADPICSLRACRSANSRVLSKRAKLTPIDGRRTNSSA